MFLIVLFIKISFISIICDNSHPFIFLFTNLLSYFRHKIKIIQKINKNKIYFPYLYATFLI